MEDTRKPWLTGWSKQVFHGFTETEAPSMGPEWFCTRSSANILHFYLGVLLNFYVLEWVFFWLFCLSLGFFSSYWVSFSDLGVRAFCLSSTVLFWSCFVLSGCCVVDGNLLFSEGKWWNSGSGEHGMFREVVDGEETMIWMYCKRIESISKKQ